MTPLAVVAGFGAIGLALVDWIAVVRGDARVERWAKPGVVALILVAALAAPGDLDTRRVLLVLALAASLVGDWFLLPGGRFEPGVAAFAVAQVAYLAIFALQPLEVPWALGGLVVAALVAVVVGRRVLSAAAAAGMGPPVAGYLVVISAMAVAATASGSVLAAAGAWLFVTSDSLLGWNRFVAGDTGLREAGPSDAGLRRLAVIVTYHLAQAALVIAILMGTAA